MAEKTRGRRQWFRQYLATLAKEGNERVALAACGAHPAQVKHACLKIPGFAESRERAMAQGIEARAARPAGRKRGRPFEIGPNQLTAILEAFEESGCAELAASLAGVSVGTIRNHRRRDPVFRARWETARARAAAICGEFRRPWHEREASFILDLCNGIAWRDAARAHGLSDLLASRIAERQGLSPEQARRMGRMYATKSANRFTVLPRGARPDRVRAANRVRDKAARAESVDLPPELAAARARLVPEQIAFLDLFSDDSLTVAQACERTGRSMGEVQAWAASNSYFAAALPPNY